MPKRQTVVDYIAPYMANCPLSNQAIAEACGFEKSNVVSMIKKGTTKLPVSRVKAFAEAIGAPPMELFRVAMKEYSPELLAVIEELYGPRRKTIVDKSGRAITPKEREFLDVALATLEGPEHLRALICAIRAFDAELHRVLG